MRPAEDVALEWLLHAGPTDDDVARFMVPCGLCGGAGEDDIGNSCGNCQTRGTVFGHASWEIARLTALIVAARREGAEEMRERIAVNCAARADEWFSREDAHLREGRKWLASACAERADECRERAAAIRALPVEGE